MRRLLTLQAAGLVLATVPGPAYAAGSSRYAGEPSLPVPSSAREAQVRLHTSTNRPEAAKVRLGGVPVRLRPGTRQVVTAHRVGGDDARVTLWVLDDGRWARRSSTRAGHVGYGGLSRPAHRRQGDGTTPVGTFDLTFAFGTHRPRPGWDMAYHRIRRGDYWVGDNASPYYNRLRNKSAGGFRWSLPQSDDEASERLLDHRSQYEYAFATSFNTRQVRHRGFAIFLHVNGGGATAGCVSAPRPFLQRLYRRLAPRLRPVIAIGG
jgi:L,D-peptidoglycan transpeptidase YkuD (ErfK/YbiS/YcfS/YnhG family)